MTTICESTRRLSRRWTKRVCGLPVDSQTSNAGRGLRHVLGETVGCNFKMFCGDCSKEFKHLTSVESLQKFTVILQ